MFPNTLKYDIFEFNPDESKEYYMQKGFIEVSIGLTPENIQYYNEIKYIRR